ncbi:MAG: hypothetical protein GY845_04175 [Planctomycetes bacterium]|nr:hypothetical protein [Planctomycetota bacterium]
MKKVFQLVVILSVLAGLSFHPAMVANVNAATNYYVSTSGSDSATGTIGDPWRHIDYAVDRVSAGDTIYVRGGTYNERVTMTSVSGSVGNIITLRNYPGETPIIDGNGIYAGSVFGGLLHVVGASYVTIDGIEVIDSSSNGILVGGTAANPVTDIIVQNCTTRRTVYSGITARGHLSGGFQDATNITVTNNIIEDPNSSGDQECLTFGSVTNFEISYNEMYCLDWETYGKAGITPKRDCTGGDIHHNEIYNINGPAIYISQANDGSGIYGFGSSNHDIHHNYIHDLKAGGSRDNPFNTHADAIQLALENGTYLDDIDIYNNIIGAGTRRGIRLAHDTYAGGGREFRNITIRNNTIYQGTLCSIKIGITAGYASEIQNLTIANNILAGDDYGMSLNMDADYVNIDNLYLDYNLHDDTSTTHGAHWVSANAGFAGVPGVTASSYRIASSSPARDKGTSSNAPSTDYWGTSRPQGGTYDIGAHEYAGSSPPPNQPPVLNSIGNKSVDEGDLLQFTISASDSDSSNLTYSASNLPSGASFNATTKAFSWTPTGAGTYTSVHFQVSDGSLTDSEDITITVNAAAPPPEPPSIAFISPTDVNSTTVARDWTEVNVSVDSTIDTSSFIDWDESLVGYWNLDENSGSSASDNSTYSNTGNLINGPQWTTGKFGSALSFDGNNDYVYCDNDESLNIANNITIETWLNPATAGEGLSNDAVLAKAESGGDWSWQLRYNGPGNYMGFNFNGNPEGSTWVSVNQNLTPGIWYHVVGVFDGTNIKCYLNGIEKDTNQISGITGGNATLFIGQDGWSNVFNGKIDEVRIWNRALSPNEIRASYNSTANSLGRQFTGLSDGTYQYYAYTTDTIGNSVQTETRTLTIATGQLYENWDVNQDGICNVLDMTLVGQRMGETGSAGWIPEDVNSDGAVDVLDMIVIGQHLVL